MARTYIPYDGPVVTRAEAKAAGLKRYFDGSPCKNGHLSERTTINTRCFTCRREAEENLHKKEPERRKASSRKYREKHRESLIVWFKNYYLKDKKKKSDYRIKWRKNNPERVREKQIVYGANRRAKLASAEGKYTVEDFAIIKKLQKYRCAACGKKTKNLAADHIIPLFKGGTNYASNIQAMCRSCNCSKHAKDPIEFMKSLGRLL